MYVYDIIKDHFKYKFIEKKLFHEYEYKSEYGSNAFELSIGRMPMRELIKIGSIHTHILSDFFRLEKWSFVGISTRAIEQHKCVTDVHQMGKQRDGYLQNRQLQ